jgi:hypothetical protein
LEEAGRDETGGFFWGGTEEGAAAEDLSGREDKLPDRYEEASVRAGFVCTVLPRPETVSATAATSTARTAVTLAMIRICLFVMRGKIKHSHSLFAAQFQYDRKAAKPPADHAFLFSQAKALLPFTPL